MEIISRYWCIILIILIVLVIRLIFRYLTRWYVETVGYIVDFNTKSIARRHSGYYHQPIVQFYVGDQIYRSVKTTLFSSIQKNPRDSLIYGYLGDSVRVRYNPNSPNNNYCLYSIKDLKYNFIVMFPVVIIILFLLFKS